MFPGCSHFQKVPKPFFVTMKIYFVPKHPACQTCRFLATLLIPWPLSPDENRLLETERRGLVDGDPEPEVAKLEAGAKVPLARRAVQSAGTAPAPDGAALAVWAARLKVGAVVLCAAAAVGGQGREAVL